MLLEDRDFLPSVYHSLIDGVGGGQVDHLAEDHPVVHLVVHVIPGLLYLELVRHILVTAHGVINPVSEGGLLLI